MGGRMGRWARVVVPLVLLVLAAPVHAADRDGDGIDDAEEASLIETYAPILHFHPDEQYLPVSVAYALEHSVLERYDPDGDPILVDADPTAAELAEFDTYADPETNPGDVHYLNNTEGGIDDDAGIARTTGPFEGTVYARVAPAGGTSTNTTGGTSGGTVVQYWLYYAFNPGTWNRHEGDWELVQVHLVDGAPAAIAVSQHLDGQRMAWADVETDGTHPRIYVALGSHANYLRSYQARLGVSGDQVAGDGPVWTPADYEAVDVGEPSNATAGNEWIRFAGLWGEFSEARIARAQVGPAGPVHREDGRMFASPAAWSEGLAVSSGLELAVNWLLANLWTVFLGLMGLAAAVTLVRVSRTQRRTHAGVRMWPFAHVEFPPRDRKSLGMLLGLAGLAIALVGAFQPWYRVFVDADAPGFLVTDGPVEFLRIGGVHGILVNPMKAGEPDLLVHLVPLPLAAMFLVLTGYFIIRVTGTETTRRLGARFLGRGVLWALPFVLILVVAATVLVPLADAEFGGVRPATFLEPVADFPLGGSTVVHVQRGSSHVSWGIALGAHLLLVGAGLLFAGGALTMSQSYRFLDAGGEEE